MNISNRGWSQSVWTTEVLLYWFFTMCWSCYFPNRAHHWYIYIWFNTLPHFSVNTLVCISVTMSCLKQIYFVCWHTVRRLVFASIIAAINFVLITWTLATLCVPNIRTNRPFTISSYKSPILTCKVCFKQKLQKMYLQMIITQRWGGICGFVCPLWLTLQRHFVCLSACSQWTANNIFCVRFLAFSTNKDYVWWVNLRYVNRFLLHIAGSL